MYQCPECHHAVILKDFTKGSSWCEQPDCRLSQVKSAESWFETLLPESKQSTYDFQEINVKTEAAYRIYSQFYSFFALLAYWIIWRGRLLKHIQFFRQILDHTDQTKPATVVDIASGEGSLTELALLRGKKKASRVILFDLSKAMLRKAHGRFKHRAVILIRGDVMKLPFQDGSIAHLTCFGGLNSFPDFNLALQEMLRTLQINGVFRGSFLLKPEAKWRQAKIAEWIQKGYQTITLSESEARSRMENAALIEKAKLSEWKCVGDVLLFEFRK